MDLKKSTNSPSKILLFGEYVILNEGMAISLPFDTFALTRRLSYSDIQQEVLENIYLYIEGLDIFKRRLSEDFKQDIKNGLFFDSTIPIGYGLGSSGALVAQLYTYYIQDKKVDFAHLKMELALIENYFHNKSSGIDPLTSYINKPLQIINEISIISQQLDTSHFFLYDSGQARDAKKAISHFQQINLNSKFILKLSLLKEINNTMVLNFLKNKDISKEMKEYSTLQFSIFSDFITPNIKSIWEYGLASNQYYMKLCGAGMGGYYLGYSHAKSEINFDFLSL